MEDNTAEDSGLEVRIMERLILLNRSDNTGMDEKGPQGNTGDLTANQRI